MHAPLAMSYRTEQVSLNALQIGEWRELAARAIEPNVFYEPAFALAAAKVFGRGACAIAVRKTSGQLAGIFPMYRGPFRIFSGYVHPYAPLGVPLVNRDDTDGVIGAWFDHLGQTHRTILMPMLADGPFNDALARVCAARTYRTHDFGTYDRALLKPGADRSGYLDPTAASKGRKGLLRRRRRLAEQGELGHRTITEKDIAQFTDIFLQLEAAGWKGRAGTAAGRDAAISAFFRDALAALGAEGKAQGELLSLDGKPVAAVAILRSGANAWAWKIAYDETLAQYSPGVQVMLDATQSLLDETAFERADSCTAPGAHMIDHLWHERLAVRDRMIRVRPGGSLKAEPTFLLENARRSIRALAKAVLRR